MKSKRLSVLTAALAALQLHGVVAQQFTPNLIFNITLNTMCGLFDYGIPENTRTRNELTGYIPWESSYTEWSNDQTFYTGMFGKGDPYHFVSAKWFNPVFGLPSIQFTFPGMGWSLDGWWKPWNYTMTQNDIEYRADGSYKWLTDASGSLGGENELSWGMHTVNYSIRSDFQGGGNWSVNELTVVTGMVSDAQSFDQVPSTTDYFIVDGKRNPKFEYFGTWEMQTKLGGYGGQGSIMYSQLVSHTATVDVPSMVSIRIPDNTSFVMVNGTMGLDMGYWGAVWEPVPAIGKSPVTVLAYTTWSVPNAVMFFQPLNPTVRYNLTLGLPYSDHMGIGIRSITYWNAISGASNGTNNGGTNNGGTNRDGSSSNSSNSQSGSHKSKAPIGAIVGGVVGGVAAIAIAAILIFCCLKRRKAASKAHEADMSRFEVDESASHATPFLVQQATTPQPQSPMHQPELNAPPVVQTFTVQAHNGGYSTGGFTTAGYANDGYSPQDTNHRNSSMSTVPFSSPGLTASPALYSASSATGLLVHPQRSATSDMDETSSVSPSMSASVVNSTDGNGKSGGAPAIASFSQYAPQPHASGSQAGAPAQPWPSAGDEKRAMEGATAQRQSYTPMPPPVHPSPPPITQELDAEAVDEHGTVPPVYNPQWAKRNSGQQ